MKSALSRSEGRARTSGAAARMGRAHRHTRPRSLVWSRWPVEGVDVPAGRREHVGAVRTCQVRMMGRRGQITERCTTVIPGHRADYVVDNDTLGFTRLASGFGFTIELDPVDPATTTVTLSSSYRPRGLSGRLANLILLRRRLRRARRTMLAQLQHLAEDPAVRDVS